MRLKNYSIIIATLVLASCANRGLGPQGGPKDTVPPHPLHSNPEMGVLNYKGKQIEITFDEYLELDNISQNLLMSPPQKTPPEVKARGKKLVVQFQDSLQDNTTYTIDFGDGVCDFRERVPLRGYTFYFSTGPEIDTLMTFGRVFDAQNLNPVQGVLAGVHTNMDDSAFVAMPFARVARTDSTGRFCIRNMKEGTYRIYALDDVSRDYRLTVSEALAFGDKTIQPIDISPMMEDSSHLAIDSTLSAVDTISEKVLPEIPITKLFLFKEAQQRLYLQRTQRELQHTVRLIFSSAPDSLPSLRAMRPSENDSTKSDSAWIDPMPYIYTQYSKHADTITLWLTDSVAISQDSLFFEARYRRTDSLYRLEWCADTLRAIWRAPKLTAKAKEAQARKNRNRRLELKSNARSGFEIYDTLRLSCSTPLAAIEADSIHLFERVDTILKPMPFRIAEHDTLPMSIAFIANLKPEGKYELHLDSGALHDVYGITHIKGMYALQLKSVTDYSTLRVKMTPFDSRIRIQVLNNQDMVLRELSAVPEGALFEYLKPDTYYLRCYIDWNGDGQWTTGNWAEKRQPEPVYYFPEKIQTKSNWDFEEEWDYTAIEQTESKPKELIKAPAKK